MRIPFARPRSVRPRSGVAGTLAVLLACGLAAAGCGSTDAGGTAPVSDAGAVSSDSAAVAGESAGPSPAAPVSSGGSSQQLATSSAAPASGFTFTDDRGVTVSLDKPDIRVVAQEDAANALMHLGIKPVGIFGGSPMSSNPMLKGLDLSGVESLGETFGEIKMEKLVVLKPDVIISTFYTGDGVLFPGGVYGFGTEKLQKDAQSIAPILALDSTKPSSTVISRFSELAAALGADVAGGDLATAKATWEDAVAELKKAAAAHGDLTVLATTPATDQMYFAVPDLFPDLLDLKDWGVKVMTPTGKLVSSYYEAVSWENAAEYQPDIVLVDARGYTLSTDELNKYPTWTAMKAVAAGQLGTWVRVSLNYPDYTVQIQQLTKLLNSAKKVS